jgi:hypothetical protein
MVVVPGPSPMDTGFGDAVIVAVDDAGLADATFAMGFSERLHAAKKNSSKRIAMFRINRFIKNLLFEFLELLTFIKSYISKAVNRNRRLRILLWIQNGLLSKPFAAILERVSRHRAAHYNAAN